MDESTSLDALNALLNQLVEKPHDISLHAQHIRLSEAAGDATGARELLTDHLAATDAIWIPLIDVKIASSDITTEEGANGVLEVFERAENDYYSIPIYKKHLEYVIDQYSQYVETPKPGALGELFSVEWTRVAIANIVGKASQHPTKGQELWDIQRDWEMERLEAASKKDRLTQIAASDDTFQSYSTFTTKHKPAEQYEPLLVAASKIRSQSVKSWTRREQLEQSVLNPNEALTAYQQLIASSTRAKSLDAAVVSNTYERAINEAASLLFRVLLESESQEGHLQYEQVLRGFWVGYVDFCRGHDQVSMATELSVLRRAVRSVPTCGEIWARYIRLLERDETSDDDNDEDLEESVAEIFDKAIPLVQSSSPTSVVDDIVPVVLARAGYEKRRLEAGDANEEALATMLATLEGGIEMVKKANPQGDSKYRLEKYLAGLYSGSLEMPDSAIAVWKAATERYKTSYATWINYTDLLIKTEKHEEARAVFQDVHKKNLDWPEAVWEAWSSFEHLYASNVEDVEAAGDMIAKAQSQVNTRRAKEAEKANYQSMQIAAEQQSAAATSVADAPVPVDMDAPMDVDVQLPAGERGRGTKRPAPVDEERGSVAERNKKAKLEPASIHLKRDRENCTVFVADLPANANEDDLNILFKDCGAIREVKITPLQGSPVATIEFMDRTSVPAALTKDKKRIHEQEVAVHLAWQSTLYVANFPEKTDDAAVKQMFGEFGTIFDVRWPSKKFKSSRRFCYVQYTSPAAAQSALSLHGRELESGHPMDVLISNPERKKERTDQGANEKELYVAGLSKFTTKDDLEKIFKTYGQVKEVRVALDKDGQCKGFAFVEFDDEKEAMAALDANNYTLKKRRIAVTLVDPKIRNRNKNFDPSTGFGRRAEAQNRSLRIRNVPQGAQEGLLQQCLEKLASVKRVEVFSEEGEAVVELENASEVGKLLLRSEPVGFQGNQLEFAEDSGGGAPGNRNPAKSRTKPNAPPPRAGGLFVPRAAAVSRPRAGLGHARRPAASAGQNGGAAGPSAGGSGPKGQDDFRKMLEG